MKPAVLLMRDLLRAHSTFLLHHDSSLSALFVRSRRSRFVAVLTRYWDLYLATWNVMLHGNPAREVFGGINIAASGELGVGVGEEERGSGEREVLEGLVGRIEGLVDLVVSKFGEDDSATDTKVSRNDDPEPWLGTGQEPGAEDGAIFLGTGCLSRKSLRDVTRWMEDLYVWGEHAYGVIDSPTSLRRAKAKKASKPVDETPQADPGSKAPETSPPATTGDGQEAQEPAKDDSPVPDKKDDGKLDKMVSYLKLGYGSYWTIPGVNAGEPSPENTAPNDVALVQSKEPSMARPKLKTRKSSFEAAGHYLIGLKGAIEEGYSDNDSHDSSDAGTEHNARTVLRTVNIELETDGEGRAEETIIKDFEHPGSILTHSQVMGNMLPGFDSHDLNKAKKLRVVVYVNQPFVFTFLFELRTDSLAMESLYRSLHYQLAPLRKPLLASTRYRAERPSAGAVASSIYDLVWDPSTLALHSTIPNIPGHYPTGLEPWSRADALGTHLHLLNMHSATRSRTVGIDLERTQKTNRGWWIVWTRLIDRDAPADGNNANLSTIHESGSGRSTPRKGDLESGMVPESSVPESKEILLIRRASDHVGFRGGLDGGGAEGAGKVAQGIGVDTRRYVEELLSLL